MAYGIRYKLSWCAPDSTPLRYEILKNGYSGSVHEVEGSGNPFILRKLNSKGKKGTIVTTEANIEIYEDDMFSVDNIYTSDEREYQVKFYKNNVLDWVGYLLPDYFSTEIEGLPVVNLSAIDQLGTLKDVPFEEANGDNYTGRATLLTVLINCIKHTGIDLNIKVVVDIISSDWDAVDPIEPQRDLSFFRDTYIDLDRFSDKEGNVVSVYDALETTLNLCNAKIFIQDGSFWVVNKRQIELGSGNVITFSQTGLQIGSSVPLSSSIVNFDMTFAGGTQQIEPADAITEVYSEHGPQIPIPQNSEFKGYSGTSYPNWTNHNGYEIEPTSVEPVRYDASGNLIQSEALTVPKPWIKSGLAFDGVGSSNLKLNEQPYMESDEIALDAESSDSFTFNMVLRGHYNDPVVVVLMLKGYDIYGDPNGKDYLLGSDSNWSPYAGESVTKKFIEFRLPKPEGRTNTSPLAVELSNLSITSGKIPTIDRVTTSFKLVIRVYGHTGGGTSKYMMVLKSLSLTMAAANDPKGILYSLRNNRKYSKKSEPIITLFSDKVDIGENGYFTAIGKDITSTITTRSGKLTRLWAGLGSAGEYLNMLVAKQIASSYGVSHKLLNVQVEGINLSLNNHYTFTCIEGVYVLVSCEVDYSKGVTNGTFAQVVSIPLDATRSITTPLDSDKGSGIKGIGSISGNTSSGGGSQDLQGVTDIGSETTNIISAKGLRALELLTIPDIASTEAGAIWIGDGTGGTITPSTGAVWGGITGNILNQTDLINYINAHGGGGSWGSISGNLANQTDLMNALNGKLSLTGGYLSGNLNMNANILYTDKIYGATGGDLEFSNNTSAGTSIKFTIGGAVKTTQLSISSSQSEFSNEVLIRGVQLSSRIGGGNINIYANDFSKFAINNYPVNDIKETNLLDPLGGYNATKIKIGGSGNIYKTISVKPYIKYVVSMYLARVTASNVVVTVNDTINWNAFKNAQRVVTSSDWVRAEIPVTSNSSGELRVYIGMNDYPSSMGGAQQGLGDILVYGLKIEEGNVTTPLVPSIQEMTLQQVADYGRVVEEINVKTRLTIGTNETFAAFHSAAKNNTGSASSFIYGDYYGTVIAVNTISPSYYALNVFSGMNESAIGGSSIFRVMADGEVIVRDSITAPTGLFSTRLRIPTSQPPSPQAGDIWIA